MVHCPQFGNLKTLYHIMDKIKLKPRACQEDSFNGRKASSVLGGRRNMQQRAVDSVDDSAKVYTTRFHDLEQVFATGIPAGYEFLGTGVAFMTNTRKRAHTVDFRNTNLDVDAEGATIEVPYDADTTIAQVKEDLATMVAGKSGKVSDAGHGKDTKYQPRRVSDNKVRGMRYGVPSSSKKLVGNRRMQDSN